MQAVRKLESEGAMPTIKKTTDYRPNGQRNLVGITRNNVMPPGSRLNELLRPTEQLSQGPSSRKNQASITLLHREYQPVPADIRGTRPFTLLVADDHPVVREGLVAMLEPQSDMRVVAQASNGRDAV